VNAIYVRDNEKAPGYWLSNVAALPVPLAPTFNETDKQSGCPTLGGAEALLVEPR